MTAYHPPPLRAAIVGTGGISRTHGRRIRDLGSSVVGICGRSLAGATALADDIGGSEVYTDLDEMLDRQRPDVLHVCSPHGYHADQSRAAMAGVTVTVTNQGTNEVHTAVTSLDRHGFRSGRA